MKKTVIVIGGPTASGKSRFALEYAQKNQGIIINGDSQQIYKDLPILTDRPLPSPIPHALYGILSHTQSCNATQWCQLARQEIDEAFQRDQVPIIVGGTGFYLKALTEGLSPIPSIPSCEKQKWNERHANIQTVDLWHALCQKDPQTAARLHPQDRQRLGRALLVLEYTQVPLSLWHQKPAEPCPYFFEKYLLWPQKDKLEEAIIKRFDHMWENGVVEEVRDFCQKPFANQSVLQKVLGFQILTDFLKGELSKDQAKQKYQIATRQYAKRQFTWFAHQWPVEARMPPPF
jgi:tRNA dimethylallyltransferase